MSPTDLFIKRLNYKEPDFDGRYATLSEIQIQNHRAHAMPYAVSESGFVTLLTPPSFFKSLETVCFLAYERLELAGYVIGVKGGSTFGNKVLDALEKELKPFVRDLRPRDRMTVAQICVSRKFRRKGIARRLYAQLEAHAADCGTKSLFTEIDGRNAASQAFHEKAGFERVAQTGSGGQEFIILRKRL